MAYTKGPDLSEIMSRIDIPIFAAQHLPPPAKKQRSNWLYDCPRCGQAGQKKVSFSPGPNKKNIPGPWVANCCGEKGNLFSLLIFMGVVPDKKGAAKLLKEAAGIKDDEQAPDAEKREGKRGAANTKNKTSKAKKGKREEKKRRGPLPMPPPSSAKIYSRVVDLSHLTPEHRKELKEKRGFTDEIINILKLRSGGEYLTDIVNQLKEEFPLDELRISGILKFINNSWITSEQLLDGNILIPYINENGEVYHLRRHKLGFSDVAPQIFCRQFLKDKPETVILTEGEFKAAALSLGWGIPSISVPGISSFSGNYFEWLTGLLQEFGVKNIVVIFDNEDKGTPGLPNYKQKIEERFDTLFYAYLMGYKLSVNKGTSFHVTIGMLPDEWRVKGKIDFDMALAQGRTKQDIEKVIHEAVPPGQFRKTLPDDARPIIERKVTRWFARFKIKREYNKYLAFRGKEDGNGFDEVISNFVINIKSNYKTGEGVIRSIELVNEYGEVSEDFMLEPGEMASSDAFKKFCFAKGNYIFKGSSNDLIDIWEFEFSREVGSVINVPEKIGRIDARTWLFGNMAIRDGKVYRPGEDGIIWIDNEGFKPQSLHLGPRDEPIEDAIPSLYDGKVDIQEIARKLHHCIGGYEAYIGIGWVVMTIFSKDIFAKYKCLPFLFPHGKRECGKSSFMRWIIRFFGIENDGISLPETSQNYIMRALGYFSSLGVWFDEYRNEPNVTKKDGYLRSAYNRQLSGKGIKNTFGARGYDVTGTIAVTGEEVPKDSGLFTRSCFIQLSSNKRNRNYYDELNIECEKFSGFVFHLITNYNFYRDKILKSIAFLKKSLIKIKISDRTAENWAIIAGCFWSTVKEDSDFILWIKNVCKDLKMTGENDHALNIFWDDVDYLVSSGEMPVNKFMDYRDKNLIIWFKGTYDAWAIHYKKKTGKEPFDWKSIAAYLRDETYFVDADTFTINNASKHCYIINPETAPDNVKEIVSYIENRQYQPKND